MDWNYAPRSIHEAGGRACNAGAGHAADSPHKDFSLLELFHSFTQDSIGRPTSMGFYVFLSYIMCGSLYIIGNVLDNGGIIWSFLCLGL